MNAYRKASIRQLSTEAYQLSAQVAAGIVKKNEEGRWMIGNIPIDEWLTRLVGEDATLILIPTDVEQPLESKVCQTCGREYIGTSCPYCREVRLRLRGK